MKASMTFEQMSSEVLRQYALKKDYIQDTRRLEMVDDGYGTVMRMMGDDGIDMVEPMDINSGAHRQIGTHCGIPYKYYDRMRASNNELLAENVNSWFNLEPEQRMVRTLDGTVRAFLSNRYRRIDHLDIMNAVLPIIGEIPNISFVSCDISDSKMFIKAINPNLQTEITPGDVVQSGIVISNSETGQGRVSVQPLIYRLVCLNGMVSQNLGVARNHIGRINSTDENNLLYKDDTLLADDRALMLKIRDSVRAAVDEVMFESIVDTLREAKTVRMDTSDIPAVVRLSSRQFGLHDSEGEGVLNRLIETGDFTLYGLANAVTRHSQDVEDYERASDLEGIGYEMVTMSPVLWNRINRPATAAAA